MAAIETNTANGAESTLSSSLSSGATTINVTDTSSFPSVPFYAVIDPDVDASREVILVDSSKTATTFVLSAASKRGLDGTTDTAHSSGAKVVCVPIAALWTDINDRVDASYNPGGTDVAVADGGTGASDAATARTNLGLGTIATQAASNVAITGGSVTGITDIAVADGGTGASDAATARTNLGAAADADLTAHTGDTTDAHDASAISVADAGGYFTSTDVEGALQELGGGGATVARKAADESVTSSTTLQNDDDLAIALAANEVWVFEAGLFYTAASSDDLKVAFTVPTGASLVWGGAGVLGSTSSTAGDVQMAVKEASGDANVYAGAGSTTPVHVQIRGYVANGANAGNLQLQWAQSVSGGTAATVKAGSHLIAHKVA